MEKIDKIRIDLRNWSNPSPTGVVAYSGDTVISSAYCDSAEEFADYFKELPCRIAAEVLIDINDAVNENLAELVRQIHSALLNATERGGAL